jgi:fibro-slime domain-containing protein
MRNHVYAWVLACGACSAAGGNVGATDFTGGSAGSAADGGAGAVGGVGGSAGTVIITEPPDSGGKDAAIITSLPPGFVGTEIGGYKLGAALGDGTGAQDAGTAGNEDCGNILLGVVRDFKGRNEPGGHPDFEGPLYGNDITLNLVAAALGTDQKPVYASMCEEGRASPAPTCPFGPETTTLANFDQWYRYAPNVNQPFIVELWFAPQSNGIFTFQSLFFYPLDNAGWGNSGTGKEGQPHNFSFTTELHTRFQYRGRETFQFEGDDDVWVFINNRLAVDLGGLHPKVTGSVDLDARASEFGISTGNVYTLDLFHAERHTPESTFRIDTNLSFVDCGTVIPDIPK